MTVLASAAVPPASADTGTTPLSGDVTPGTAPATGTHPSQHLAAAQDAAASDGLQMVVNERGLISQSTAAGGNDDGQVPLTIRKPAGATVRKAFLAYATTEYLPSRCSGTARRR